MSNAKVKEFGPVRNFLWPIHGHEMKKFIPMFVMMFCISFNYSMLRNFKDSLVITAPGSDAGVIPYLKLWCTTPMAILFTMLYMKLSNILSKERLFYAVLLPFVTFFLVFPTLIYPNISFLHPSTSADYLQTLLPQGMGGFVAIYRNWSFALFYTLAELWGSMVLSVLFWTLANEITKVTEAKRFYGLFLLGANIALMCIKPSIDYIQSVRKALPAGVDSWGVTINLVMTFMVISTVVIALCYYYVRNHVMTDERLYDPTQVKTKKKKEKMGLWASVKYLSKSKYLASIAFLVLAYGISINVIEVNWKQQIKLLYPNSADNFEFMGEFAFSTGLFTCILLFLGTGNVLRKFGWTKAALITPTVLLITGTLYFINVIFNQSMTNFLMAFGTNPLNFIVLIGMAQNVFTKGCKYSFFDPTKEMAYIPLDEEEKVKGKAAIDGVGGRLGKSGGAFINMILILIVGSVEAITPYVAITMAFMVFGWFFVTVYLGKEFNRLTQEKAPEEAFEGKKGNSKLSVA